jgi:hypothetical protein
VHAGERGRAFPGEPRQHGPGAPGVGIVIERLAEPLAGLQDVRTAERRVVGAALGEEIAAEKRARLALHQEAAFPGMREVRRLDPAQGMATERDELAVGERARAPVGKIIHGNHGGDAAAERRGVGRHRQELVERAALVRLEMRERDPAHPLDRHHALNSRPHLWEAATQPRMEEQRLVVDDQVLAEAEPAGSHARRQRRGDAVDPIGDLVDARVGLRGS